MPRTKSAESSKRPTAELATVATAKPKKPQRAVAPKEPAPPEQPGRARYRLVGPELAPEVRNSGRMASSPVFNAMAVMGSLQKNLAGEKATADSLMLAVDELVAQVQAGDLSEIEGMLVSQALSLQTVYASLARRATQQEYMKQYQTYFTLALKAQAQSRATLEALIELKQPRHAPTFIKQANMANGPQQVNNGSTAGAQPLTPAEQSASAPTKLLEADTSPTFEQMSKGVNDERLEQRTPRAPG